MTHPIKLFVFDFDGTALGGHTPYDQFPRPFARFIDQLGAMGIGWATNTTWGPEGQFVVAKRSGVKTAPTFLTGQTGRLLATVKNGQLVPDHAHEKRIIARENRFRRTHWPRVRKLFMKLLADDLVTRIAFDFFHQNMVTFTCRPGQTARVWAILDPLLASGKYYAWTPKRGRNGTLLAWFQNKGEIVKLFHRRLHLKPENILVAGDASNDLHMFDPTLARWMVCPANAEPCVQQAVRQHGGVVATQDFSWGVIEGVSAILTRLGQTR